MLRNSKKSNDETRKSSNTSSVCSMAPTEMSAIRHVKYGNPFQVICGIFKEYCHNTSIHGLKYLGSSKVTIIEKIFWIVTLMFSTVGCILLIFNIYMKWLTFQEVVNFSQKTTAVWQIPFPAVTICPETRSRQSIFNFTDIYHRIKNKCDLNVLTNDEYRQMSIVSQVCHIHLFENCTLGEEFMEKEYINDLFTVAPLSNDTLFYCKYGNTMDFCENFFAPILTEDGVCYTFNGLDGRKLYTTNVLDGGFFYYHFNATDSEEWTLENGYTSTDPHAYPRRVLAAGNKAGFYVLLGLRSEDLDYLCSGPTQGFKLILHTPSEQPRSSKGFIRVPFSSETVVTVTPNIVQTLDLLKDFTPERRQCYFNNERQLKYFRYYTQSNCELECLTNYTLKMCGCVKFNMPREETTKVCGPMSYRCVNDATFDVLIEEVEAEISSKINHENKPKCNCLPACTSIQYNTEISQGSFSPWRRSFNAHKESIEEYNEFLMSKVTIFFKEAPFVASVRSELYSFTDFMADCGGLLGLFIGCSVLSLAEVIYFCTLHFRKNLKMRQDTEAPAFEDNSMDFLEEIIEKSMLDRTASIAISQRSKAQSER